MKKTRFTEEQMVKITKPDKAPVTEVAKAKHAVSEVDLRVAQARPATRGGRCEAATGSRERAARRSWRRRSWTLRS